MKTVLCLVTLMMMNINLYSQLQIQIKQIDPTDTIYRFNIDVTEFTPTLKAQIKVVYNGSQIELTKDNFFILEGIQTALPTDLSPIKDGWQTVKWISEKTIFDSLYTSLIVCNYDNKMAYQFAIGLLQRMPYIIVTNDKLSQLRDVFWTDVTPGNSFPIQIRIKGQVDANKNDAPYSLKIDSITTNTKYFRVKWVGSDSDFDRNPPPRFLRVGSYYWVNIFFEPDKFGYYQDILTIHFEGGLKRIVPLYGNNFTVQSKTLIQLVQPNGGEILTPCEDYEIKWKGHAPNFPTDVYYSKDGGYSWTQIASVMDSVYIWKVPDEPTEHLLFKVRQNFNESKEYILHEDNDPVYSIGFNRYSTLLTSVSRRGKVLTFDLKNTDPPKPIRKQFLGTPDGPNSYISLGTEYSQFDTTFYVCYRNANKDSIAIFNKSSDYPVKTFALPNNFRASHTVSDNNKKFFAIIPQFGNQLLIYSLIDGSFIRSVDFKTQLMDFAFNSDLNQATALLIDGKIQLMNLTDFSVVDEMSFGSFPNFSKIALSPNGKLLSIGSESDGTGLKTNVYVIDISTKRIVRVFNPSVGDPIKLFFNPSSSVLIIGSTADKQIAFYDLASITPAESLFGHFSLMTDIQLSPAGHSLASTATSSDNLVYRTFVYPEEDASDAYAYIRRPKLNNEKIILNTAYLGTFNIDSVNNICNLSDVFADIRDAYFQNGIQIKLKNKFERDTILPNGCLKLQVEFNPIDTGRIADTLVLRSCSTDYKIPFEAISLPRHITFFNDGFDFGDVCIGDTAIHSLQLFKNEDPVPLIVNKLSPDLTVSKLFSLTEILQDTILPAGGILSGNIGFIPDTLGIKNGKFIINHSNQTKITASFGVKGKGIGSYVELSHNELYFIPEILTRTFTIKNIGILDIYFQNLKIVPEGVFNVVTDLNFNLKPNESKDITIAWNGTDYTDCVLIMEASPCLVQKFIPLRFYKGNSLVELTRVETPSTNENVEIPVSFRNAENSAYKGMRFFEAEFSVNPYLFLPLTVESQYGKANLIKNYVNGTERKFTIRVEGDFGLEGKIATIKGVAGLSDTNYSDIKISKSSVFWGKTVNVQTKDGGIFINNICDDRYIAKTDNFSKITSVNPNPADDFVVLEFESMKQENIKIIMQNNLGEIMFNIDEYKTLKGTNQMTIRVNSFSTGIYRMNIISGNNLSSREFIIMR